MKKHSHSTGTEQPVFPAFVFLYANYSYHVGKMQFRQFFYLYLAALNALEKPQATTEAVRSLCFVHSLPICNKGMS